MNIKRPLFSIVFVLLLIIIISFLPISYVGPSGEVVKASSSVVIDPGIQVYYEEFDNSTTNFLYLADNELEAVENLTLEKSGYGKIYFKDKINLTQDSTTGVIDLDSNINISYNHIEVDPTKLTSLNRSAVLYFYNLKFTNPRILRDGSVCPANICKIIKYTSSGMLKFNVTSFSVYSAEETPSSSPTPTSTGTTSGGGGISLTPGFTVDKDFIITSITQSKSKKESITITNTGSDSSFSIQIDSSDLNKFMTLSDTSISLNSGESKTITIDISANERAKIDAYAGNIIIQGKSSTKIINVALEVKPVLSDLDINTKVLNKNAQPNQNIFANIEIVNKGDPNILLGYAVKDFDGNIFTFKEENLSVKQYVNLTRKLKLSKTIPIGNYILYSKADNKYTNITSIDVFKVTGIQAGNVYFSFETLNIILIMIILTAVVFYLKQKKYIKLN
ncbi:hypothetical protein GF374_00265 [Candidatus Woesearchaeota archaeon]|nr:hypothetical protein [Candidatus Woesearchaeota archaeon]